MKLRHFSYKPLKDIRSVKQSVKGEAKPRGLWLSDEDDSGWFDWCSGEEFALERLHYEYEVTLSDKANILHIKSAGGLQAFQDEFVDKRETSVNQHILRDYVNKKYEWQPHTYEIRWDLVAKKYDGIIISPYIWSERLGNKMWYYGWDCASGCIWNKEAIAKTKLVRRRPSFVKRGKENNRKHQEFLKNQTEITKRLIRTFNEDMAEK